MTLKPATTEAEVTAEIREFLKLKHIFHWKQFQAMRGHGKSKKGIADIIGVLPESGRMLAIEIKKPGGKVSPEQITFIDAVNASGGLAFVAYSVEEVMDKIKAVT